MYLKFVFFFAWQEACFCYRNVTMAVDMVTWQSWRYMEFVCDNLLTLETLLRRDWWNLLSWNVGWWYSKGASAWSLHPYTVMNSHQGIEMQLSLSTPKYTCTKHWNVCSALRCRNMDPLGCRHENTAWRLSWWGASECWQRQTVLSKVD